MYNLLVTARLEAWALPAYEYDTDRFGEYTSPTIMARLKPLSSAAIEELLSWPALFAYEGTSHDARVGYLRRIKQRARSILVEYDIEQAIPPIPFARIEELRSRLDIDKWELNRTHWAIKDENLLEILRSAALIDDSFSTGTGVLGRLEEMSFKVALSFPGEQRAYVGEVAEELKRRLPPGSVFCDRDFTSQLARPHLDTLLQRVYLSGADLVVVFVSSDYERKSWCGLEWRAIRDIIKNKSDHAVMFMRFDDSALSGTFSVDGFVDLREWSPLDAARFIIERVRLNDTTPR